MSVLGLIYAAGSSPQSPDIGQARLRRWLLGQTALTILTDEEAVLLVAVYAKAEQDNMLPKDIRKVV